ncbi:MAG: HEAT repeat domain-containing protein [Chloroflexi bacterium]|nr:HEAT repeat domain-containing protein [Chloroflexota bacterium]
MTDAKNSSERPEAAAVDRLVAELAGEDGFARERARQALVDIGEPALDSLIKALSDKRKQVRWEAAKALHDIGHLRAGPALVRALEDREFDVRWLAAEGLIVLGRSGAIPLLGELVANADRSWLRQGAHHVLNHLAGGDVNEHHIMAHPIAEDKDLGEILKPVVEALEDVEPAVSAPLAAKTALDALRSTRA